MTRSDTATKAIPLEYTLRAQGDRCLSVDFGDEINATTGRICLSAAKLFKEAHLQGVVDITPSFNSVALLYTPEACLSDSQLGAFERLSEAVHTLLAHGLPELDSLSRTVEIPVCYGGEFGPDLDYVAQCTGLSTEEVIRLHTESEVMVFMLGFAPGLPYLGVHETVFAIPRRAVPRTAVPAGSVALANRQTTIYPNLLPGGWHIIGATPLKIFDVNRTPPSVLMPGDQVRFVAISAPEYQARHRAEHTTSPSLSSGTGEYTVPNATSQRQ